VVLVELELMLNQEVLAVAYFMVVEHQVQVL
jgi:hypothetical protein